MKVPRTLYAVVSKKFRAIPDFDSACFDPACDVFASLQDAQRELGNRNGRVDSGASDWRIEAFDKRPVKGKGQIILEPCLSLKRKSGKRRSGK
jgi:hypothetical protein